MKTEDMMDVLMAPGAAADAGQQRGAGTPSEAAGLVFIHGADRWEAHQGETLTFATTVVNTGKEPLENVALMRRSFTTPKLKYLRYTSQPLSEELKVQMLLPGQSVTWVHSYCVGTADGGQHGEFISAMRVTALSAAGAACVIDRDAVVTVI